MLVVLTAVIVIILYALSIYLKNKNAICKSKKNLYGRTAIVTGGTSGIGLEIALDFARRDARVIIACPYEEEGIRAEKQIVKTTGNTNIIFKLLDLSSLKSIREFSSDVIKNEDRLDILVNNAGVGVPGDFSTSDGMHFIMQVNYYGHFLLTLLLLPLLMKSGTELENSRIVNMSSLTRFIASLDLDNYDKIGYWFKIRVYANSKLCLALFSRELTKRLSRGKNIRNVIVNTADPGLVATTIYQSFNVIIGYILKIILNMFFKNPLEGAQTAIHLAIDEKVGLVSGEMYANCEIVGSDNSVKVDIAASRLWDRSVKLVKLENHELKMFDI